MIISSQTRKPFSILKQRNMFPCPCKLRNRCIKSSKGCHTVKIRANLASNQNPTYALQAFVPCTEAKIDKLALNQYVKI